MTSAAPAPTAPAPGRPAPGQGWSRLHPLTPVLRGWRVLAAAAAVLGEQALRTADRRLTVGTGAAILVLALALAFVAWRRTRWRIEGADLRIESGVLTRRSRRVPLARLQSVDVVRPLVGRFLGVAELRLEVVGHGESAALSYLGEDEAQAVRTRLLALAHGVAEPAAAPPELVLVQVPGWRLVASVLLSRTVLWFAVAVGYVAVAAVVEPRALPGVLAATLPGLLATGRRVALEFDFTVADSPDGLRLRHGLLETRAQTVPRGRVQAVRVIQPLLWRPFDWVRVEVDVARHHSRRAAGREERIATSALLPVAPRAVADRLLADVIPGVRLGHLATSPAPRRARLRAPLSFPHLGVAWEAGHVVSTSGWLRLVTDVVPYEKIQSLRLVQGPVQRRLRLATLHLDTAGRDVHAAGRHRDADEAGAMLERGAALARTARRLPSHGHVVGARLPAGRLPAAEWPSAGARPQPYPSG